MRAWSPFKNVIVPLGILTLLVTLAASQDTGGFPDDDTGGFPDDDTGGFPGDDTGGFPDDDTGGFPDDEACPATREMVQNLSPIAGKQFACAAGQYAMISTSHLVTLAMLMCHYNRQWTSV